MLIIFYRVRAFLSSFLRVLIQLRRDTQHLASLIEERDQILEQLEIAEARYIASFRLSSPEPSIAELPVPPEDENDIKRQISRPRALTAAPVSGFLLIIHLRSTPANSSHLAISHYA